MKVVDIALEVFEELGNPSDVSTAAISFWLKNNIGTLNNLLKTNYVIDNNYAEISPELGDNEKAVFKKLYSIHYCEKQIRRHLGAAGLEVLMQVSADGATVRRASKTEVSKTYMQLKKEESLALSELVYAYLIKKSVPLHVTGDDHLTALEQDT